MRTGLLARATVMALLLGAGVCAPVSPVFAAHTQCSDGIDNDQDGRYDYPEDSDCQSIDDNSEWVDEGFFVTITDGREQVQAGDSIVYIITLKQQRESVKLANVTLNLPFQTTIVSTTDDGRVEDGRVVWNKVAVFRDNVRTLTVHVILNPNAQQGKLLVARVVADNVQATDTTMVAAGPRIPYAQNQAEVTVTDHRDYAMPGDIIEYVVTVKNTTDSAIVIPVKFTLSPVTGVLSASPQAERFGRDLWWRDIAFDPHQSRAFIVKALLDPRVMSHYPIQVVALAGFDVAVDRTVVGPIFGRYALHASITDSRETAARGELVHYKIRIKNQSARLITDLSVNAALPVHSEFAGAGEGGWWDGDTVRWQELQIAPGGSRELLFTIRVRGDAQDGEALKASAYVDGSIVNDVTVVSGGTYSPAVFAPYLQSAKSAKSNASFRSGSPFLYLSQP